MIEEQKMVEIKVSELLAKVAELKKEGYRLVQICCTRTDIFEINYSFDKDFQFINLRVNLLTAEEKIPSVSGIYWPALLYENEMHDLFGIQVTDMALDFGGNFYKTTVKVPFGAARPSAAKPEGGVSS
jgi:ech hydrogenase subunit D